jgi:hypothetical protein
MGFKEGNKFQFLKNELLPEYNNLIGTIITKVTSHRDETYYYVEIDGKVITLSDWYLENFCKLSNFYHYAI